MSKAIEMSRVYDFSLLSALNQEQKIEATADECCALAERFNILGIHDFSSHFIVTHDQEAQCFKIAGRMTAHVTQACVVSLEPVEEVVETPITIKVRIKEKAPQNIPYDDDGDAMDEDIEYITSTRIDMGELLSQYLSLALNPYPRKKGLESVAPEKPSLKTSPFSVLASLEKEDSASS